MDNKVKREDYDSYNEFFKASKYSERRDMVHDIHASDGEWVGIIKGKFFPKKEFIKEANDEN